MAAVVDIFLCLKVLKSRVLCSCGFWFGFWGVSSFSEREIGINVLKKSLLSLWEALVNQRMTVWKKGIGQASKNSALQLLADGQYARMDKGSRG